MPPSPGNPRLLILCVDRDDDIGVKAGKKTPIVGKEACISAAVKLSLADPEEADANAIFAAVKLYEELREKGRSCEVAVVGGDEKGGLEADQRIKSQVLELKKALNFKEIVLVSDGIEDERIVPVIQSIAPIASVHRIIIKHSASVEESYAILAKYLRMLIYDIRYSKFFLGIPGILLTIYGIVFFTPFHQYVNYVLAFILGFILIVRGFALDKAFQKAKKRPIFYARIFAFIASVLIFIVASVQAYLYIVKLPEYQMLLTNPEMATSLTLYLTGVFIENAQPMIWLAVGINFLVGAVYHGIRRSHKLLRDLIGLATLMLFYLPTLEFSRILRYPQRPAITIISLLLLGLAALIVLAYVIYRIYMERRQKIETV